MDDWVQILVPPEPVPSPRLPLFSFNHPLYKHCILTLELEIRKLPETRLFLNPTLQPKPLKLDMASQGDAHGLDNSSKPSPKPRPGPGPDLALEPRSEKGYDTGEEHGMGGMFGCDGVVC